MSSLASAAFVRKSKRIRLRCGAGQHKGPSQPSLGTTGHAAADDRLCQNSMPGTYQLICLHKPSQTGSKSYGGCLHEELAGWHVVQVSKSHHKCLGITSRSTPTPPTPKTFLGLPCNKLVEPRASRFWIGPEDCSQQCTRSNEKNICIRSAKPKSRHLHTALSKFNSQNGRRSDLPSQTD
jgi:hypothetical protein